MSEWKQTCPDLWMMVRAGAAAVRRYTGLTIAVYLVQLAISVGAAFVMMRVLASEFAHRPIFDRAVDGDVAAMAISLLGRSHLIADLFWIGIVAVAVYWVLSAPLAAGVISVFLHRPHGRHDVAAGFGRGALVHLFAYLRLALWSLIPYGIAIIVLAVGLQLTTTDLIDEVSLGRALLRVAGGAGPGALLLAIVGTAVDYARIDLARHDALAPWRALVRAFRLVFTRARPLLFTLLYWLAFAAATGLYVGVTFDRPMVGAAGAVSLVILRQALSIARFAARMATIAGQVELSQMQVFPPPPRPARR